MKTVLLGTLIVGFFIIAYYSVRKIIRALDLFDTILKSRQYK